LLLEVEIGRCASGVGECVVREVLRKESATNASLTAILETTGSTNTSLTLALNERNAIILQLENLPPSGGRTVTTNFSLQLTMQTSPDGSVVLKRDDTRFIFDRDNGALLRILLQRANVTEKWINDLGL
jgi:hypothetical protein